MRVVTALLGAALTLLVVADLINAMLVPRGSFSPIARMTGRMVTGSYRLATRVTSDYPRQHRILATAGPVAVLMQLIVYVASLILTMGMVVYGLSPLDGTTSLYQSGATLTTLGIVAPVTAASAIATFVAAFLGLVAIAVFIGYLLAIYSAYSARESLVSRWSLLAGEPADTHAKHCIGKRVLSASHLRVTLGRPVHKQEATSATTRFQRGADDKCPNAANMYLIGAC